MKITVFTSNQPRHVSLIESLSNIADDVFAVQECNTIFPGEVDDFFKRSDIMQKYFSHMINAEKSVFGRPRFIPSNVRSLCIKSGDLNKLELEAIAPALKSDYYIIFGSSYIKGPLCDFLVSHRAYNVHMGLSPFYRGSGCNFWALFDGKPDFVGATIHLLTEGLDSGPMLFHTVPKVQKIEPFLLGMLSVKSAHEGLLAYLKTGEISEIEPVQQDKESTIRYTRNRDFTDYEAEMFLKNPLSENEIFESLKKRNNNMLLRPYIL